MSVMVVMSHVLFLALAIRLAKSLLAHLIKHVVTLLDNLQESLALKLIYRSRDNLSIGINSSDKLHIGIYHRLLGKISPA